ncbi:hypothetical protein INR49_004415 [Caranx melampygus]|nr:hypothetical protein INR49_004415 [Caranx melampygus]
MQARRKHISSATSSKESSAQGQEAQCIRLQGPPWYCDPLHTKGSNRRPSSHKPASLSSILSSTITLQLSKSMSEIQEHVSIVEKLEFTVMSTFRNSALTMVSSGDERRCATPQTDGEDGRVGGRESCIIEAAEQARYEADSEGVSPAGPSDIQEEHSTSGSFRGVKGLYLR